MMPTPTKALPSSTIMTANAAALPAPAGPPTAGGSEIWGMTARALADSIASGRLSSEEAVRAHIDRIEALDASLNAACVRRFEAALAEARRADEARRRGEALGRLHGVPFTIKESLDLEGTASTFGMASRTGARAPRDDRHVARLRQAGAIPIAKTNVAQLLLYFESDNPLFGRTTNPWNPARTPGGSSGGEAALIASGGSPLGLGTDLGGSVRIPAAFCGLASLKPTAGRLPDAGRGSVPFGQRAIESQVGVLARTTADVALGIEVANGGRAPEVPGFALGDPAGVDLSGLRVGYYEDDGIFAAGPAARRAVREAAAALQRRGARVTPWRPYEVETGLGLFFSLLFADGFAGAKRALGKSRKNPIIADMAAGASAPPALSPLIQLMLRLQGRPGIAVVSRNQVPRTTDAYWQLVERLDDYRQRFAAALDTGGDGGAALDIILCPPSPVPAFRHGDALELATLGSYTALWNVLGYAAGVVPVTRVRDDETTGRAGGRDKMGRAARAAEVGSAGLPIGAQVVARPWREHVALAAMAAVEADASTRPEFPRCPTGG